MSDKDLSKPVSWRYRATGANGTVATTWYYTQKLPEYTLANEYWDTDEVYSGQYIRSLLGRIESIAKAHIALQQLCEVYRSAYEEASLDLKGKLKTLSAECCSRTRNWTHDLEQRLAGKIMQQAGEDGGQYSLEYVQALLARIAVLERDHAKLRDGMAEIHNTVTYNGAETSLAAIRAAARNYYDESKLMPAENDGIPPAHAGSNSARDVIAERLRQVTGEGWTPEHDDQHSNGELARAAACYAVMAVREEFITDGEYAAQQKKLPFNWPWDPAWWKPVSPRRDLVRAGALILAEIDRIDRCKKIAEPGDSDD